MADPIKLILTGRRIGVDEVATTRRTVTATGLETFLGGAIRAFRRAAESTGVIERRIVIADLPLTLRCAGPALVPALMDALEHHPPAPTDQGPGFTILAWDSASTGAPPPPAPPNLRDATARGAIATLSAGDVKVFVASSYGIVMAASTRHRLALFWTRERDEVPTHERAAPMRPLLHVWLRGHGVHLLHGAAVADAGAAALIAGPGGCGKSVTALACLRAGLSYLGDDFCAVSTDGDRVLSWSLYATAKVDTQFAATHPELGVGEGPHTRDGKRVLLLSRSHANLVTSCAVVRAILVPRLCTNRRETRTSPITQATALREIAPSTMLLLPEAQAADLQALSLVLRRLPAYRIDLGSYLPGIAPAVRKVMNRP